MPHLQGIIPKYFGIFQKYLDTKNPSAFLIGDFSAPNFHDLSGLTYQTKVFIQN
jgi:hypothetical protein